MYAKKQQQSSNPKIAYFIRGEEKRVIPYNELYDNKYLVRDVFQPYFNRTLAETDGVINELKELTSKKKDDIRTLNSKYLKYCLKMGENEGGIFIKTKEELISEDKEVSFIRHDCWETGIIYYQLEGRYGKEIFDAMRPHLQYHAQEFEEEGNWVGWYTCDRKKVALALQKLGWTISGYSLDELENKISDNVFNESIPAVEHLEDE